MFIAGHSLVLRPSFGRAWLFRTGGDLGTRQISQQTWIGTPYDEIMMIDLSDDEKVSFVRRTIEDDRYPLLPRIRTLKAILAKLIPAAGRHNQEPFPARLPSDRPRVAVLGSETATQQVKSGMLRGQLQS